MGNERQTDIPLPALHATLNVEPHSWPHLRPCLSLPQPEAGPGPLLLS